VGFVGLAGGGVGVGGRGLSWFTVYGGEGWMGRERTSKIGLGKMVWSSFRWFWFWASVCMWNFSKVFGWGPLLW
jgi:hypothetical protein